MPYIIVFYFLFAHFYGIRFDVVDEKRKKRSDVKKCVLVLS